MSAPAAAPARPVLEHLNSAAPTSSTAADIPSVFETLASDELRDLIQPAFRYVLAVSPSSPISFVGPEAKDEWWPQFFAQRYPRYLLRLINSHEEVYAVFLAGIEGFHLHTYSTSATSQTIPPLTSSALSLYILILCGRFDIHRSLLWAAIQIPSTEYTTNQQLTPETRTPPDVYSLPPAKNPSTRIHRTFRFPSLPPLLRAC